MNNQLTRETVNGISLGELIKQLQDMESDLGSEIPVVFAYPSGDYWKTVIGKTVGNIEEGRVSYSEYHRKLKIEEEDDDADTTCSVIILS